MKKKGSLSEKIQKMTYMQAAVGLLIASLILTALCLWRAIASGGEVSPAVTLMGFLAFALAIGGAGVTLYGHFAVRMDSKTHWLWGLLPNAAVIVFYILMMVIGVTA